MGLGAEYLPKFAQLTPVADTVPGLPPPVLLSRDGGRPRASVGLGTVICWEAGRAAQLRAGLHQALCAKHEGRPFRYHGGWLGGPGVPVLRRGVAEETLVEEDARGLGG